MVEQEKIVPEGKESSKITALQSEVASFVQNDWKKEENEPEASHPTETKTKGETNHWPEEDKSQISESDRAAAKEAVTKLLKSGDLRCFALLILIDSRQFGRFPPLCLLFE